MHGGYPEQATLQIPGALASETLPLAGPRSAGWGTLRRVCLEVLAKACQGPFPLCPPWLQQAAAQGFAYRWSALLSVAAQRAFACSLQGAIVDNESPELSDLLAEVRFVVDVEPSRLPPTQH